MRTYEEFKKAISECVTLQDLFQLERDVYSSDLSDSEKTDLAYHFQARIGNIAI